MQEALGQPINWLFALDQGQPLNKFADFIVGVAIDSSSKYVLTDLENLNRILVIWHVR